MNAYDLRCEYLRDPLGIETQAPRLTWKLSSDRRDAYQVSYRIFVTDTDTDKQVWDSGLIASASPTAQYAGAYLTRRSSYRWDLTVRDDLGDACRQSAKWDMGLLEESEWRSHWITLERPQPETDEMRPCPYLRKGFMLDDEATKARIYVTALGLYRLFINGNRVGDSSFTPGWTDYNQRIQYQVYDVTDMLVSGHNVVGAVLADGWYCGYLGTEGQRAHYGSVPQLMMQLECTLAEGVARTIPSDDSWQATFGPHLSADIYMGETYRGDLEPEGWTTVDGTAGWATATFDAGGWVSASTGTGSSGRLIASTAPAVRELAEIPAAKVWREDDGRYLIDIGQNIAGYLRVRAKGSAGTQVRVRHAEALDDQGDLYTDNLRHARATDSYVLKGNDQPLQPWFTFHGFRYAEITGLETEPEVVAVVVGSDTDDCGFIECSDQRIERLYKNLHWSQRSNWLDIPMDCPQRDERLGWTGDITAYIDSALYNFEGAAFLTKWMRDVVDAQTPVGEFPDVAPRVQFGVGSPAWGDAGVWTPWALYLFYGDTKVLAESYPAMKLWVEMIAEANPSGIWTERVGQNYGDWLSIDADTPKELMATAVFAHSTSIVAKTAAVLGRQEESESLSDLADMVRRAFNHEFVERDGAVTGETQTGYAMAIAWDMLPPDLVGAAVSHLVANIEERGKRLSTGFFGTRLILHVLADHSNVDLAYDLLLSEEFPGWLYMVKAGATTIWEHWDSWTFENGFKNPFMNSFNHCSLGSVGSFLFGVVGGIKPDRTRPGFAGVVIAPQPRRFEHFSCSYRSIRGDVSTRWERTDASLSLSVVVPPGSQTELHLPAPEGAVITESGLSLEEVKGLTLVERTESEAFCMAGSGNFDFVIES